MKINKETRIGLFAVLMLAALFWGINFLNKGTKFTKTHTYYVVYPVAGGVQRKSPVMINGVEIGTVAEVKLNARNHVVITMQVDARHPLPLGVVATVGSGGILDKKNISILLPADGVAAAFHNGGDTLLAAPAAQTDIAGIATLLAGKADGLVGQINATAIAVQNLLSKQNQDNITIALANLAVLSQNLNRTVIGMDKLIADNSTNIGTTMSNLSTISTNLKRNSNGLDSLVWYANATLANTQAFMQLLNRNAQDGTLLHTVQNDLLYRNLNGTVNNLNALLKDIKDNPGNYASFSVFGGKGKK
jgi:phospholipid/cholesterol/gamma-HCH transport system substrate-binding protein